MLNNICWATTTYLKNEALEKHMLSLPNAGEGIVELVVSDDADMNALPLLEKLEKDYPYPIHCYSGKRGGISVNKNRCIHHFLNNSKADYLILSDDDIRIKKSILEPHTLIEALSLAHETGAHHITGYLGGAFGKADADGHTKFAEPFFEQFPPMAMNDHMVWCTGSQGILLFFTRECIEKIGYMPVMKGVYGYEHSILSMRANKAFAHKYPEFYPILRNCHRYVECLGIGNNYSDSDPSVNQKDYLKYKDEIYRGLNLKVTNSGIK